ncbi:hypothetical protein GC088_01025 [Arthrobacter sp. JZ12]|uniref:hypothetical protein n=1 Tax=Arthrobacter sp. JZ12 TaxID=2654190 RepID=UPI002B48CBD9|nr:hypothetical protein [Arthrobacter sp. JZ12]WRH23840.1 hypothetical protein GC088_01025 [Arthrobacter sp. JZ12]
MSAETEQFTGHIASLGTTSGVRIVIGMWTTSPFGAFTDVMVESLEGTRTLLAPSAAVADWVSGAYSFDIVRTVPLTVSMDEERLSLQAGPLTVRAEFGETTGVGKVLGAIPRAVGTHPRWLSLLNPVAKFLMPGVRTAGTLRDGRRQYYGVTGARLITAAEATWAGEPLGSLSNVRPRVHFGFSSAPKKPQLVDVTTTILPPAEADVAATASEGL